MFLCRASLLLLSFLGACLAHVHPGVKIIGDISCADIPPFQSYHIHTLFWQNNKNSTKAAETLLTKFMDEFHLDDSNMCKYNPGNLAETELCVFEVTSLLTVCNRENDIVVTDQLRSIRSFSYCPDGSVYSCELV
jgi:hypothetical protein